MKSARNSECENRLFSGRFAMLIKTSKLQSQAERAKRRNC